MYNRHLEYIPLKSVGKKNLIKKASDISDLC